MTKEIKKTYTFKFGNIALADDGKEAWEVDKLIGKNKKPMFTMLRFLDSNRVLVAMPTKTNDGSTKEKIKNHFNPNAEGCIRK